MTNFKERDLVSIWINYSIGEVFYWKCNTIEIIYPGRIQSAGGCDLVDAVFLFNGKISHGDVEVHVAASSWYSHGHHNNPDYNNIALHVVIAEDISVNTITADGRNIPVIKLEHIVRRTLLNNISPNFFKCPVKLLNDKHSLAPKLYVSGITRFLIKAGSASKLLRIHNAEHILYKLIARCMGYEKNSIQFEKLAGSSSIYLLRQQAQNSKLLLMSMINGLAGLLDLPNNKNRRLARYYFDKEIAEMNRFWYINKFPCVVNESDWCFFRVRPQNHPVLRLKAFGELIYRYRKTGLINGLSALIMDTQGNHFINMEKELIIFNDNLIKVNNTIGHRVKPKITLLGQSKARELMINSILPFMYAYGSLRRNRKLKQKSFEIYCSSPRLDSNHILNYMIDRLQLEFIRDLTAVEQQGLIHIFTYYCRYKYCHSCPLVVS